MAAMSSLLGLTGERSGSSDDQLPLSDETPESERVELLRFTRVGDLFGLPVLLGDREVDSLDEAACPAYDSSDALLALIIGGWYVVPLVADETASMASCCGCGVDERDFLRIMGDVCAWAGGMWAPSLLALVRRYDEKLGETFSALLLRPKCSGSIWPLDADADGGVE